jgi:hypothetical protein
MTPRIETFSPPAVRPGIPDKSYFPFPVRVNLMPVIRHWRKCAEEAGFLYRAFSKDFEETLAQHPFLLEPFDGPGRLEGLETFLQLLFAPVLPHGQWSQAIIAATVPFYPHLTLLASPGYGQILTGEHTSITWKDHEHRQEFVNYRSLYAYRIILKKCYDLDFRFDLPVVVGYENHETGLARYLKLSPNMQFFEVKNLGPLPRLDERTLQRLLDKPFDLEAWEKVLPPENFLFSGVAFMTLLDVTFEESISRTKNALLDRQNDRLEDIRREVGNLLGLPGLHLGVATLQRNNELNFISEKTLWNSLLLRRMEGAAAELLPGSIYEKVLQSGTTVIVEDLGKMNGQCSPSEQEMLKTGYRNVLLTPLMLNGKTVGLLELASPAPGMLDGLSLLKINQLKPIFADALDRHREEFENKVEAVMLEQYTAIHPTIQWRFREAAISVLDRRSNGMPEEAIVFENVYPFYGSLDIRDSSNKRNQAIVRDLLDNLGTARNVLQHGFEDLSFAILGELVYETEQKLHKLQACFCTGDEVGLTEFIRKEINPVVAHLRQHFPQLAGSAKIYEDMLSPESGIFTRNRLAYEEALGLLNRTMVECLDEEEASVQQLFPCFCEKYKTDGVEYNIYIGASVAPHLPFDQLYMDNLRLRQLLWTCKIMRRVDELQPRLSGLLKGAHCCTTSSSCSNKNEEVAMQIAPLILSYGNPITLRFRPDEKRLDVDGSYNVRYEIVKKRIDKALLKGTEERLTQPGHIAIVYSRRQEAATYKRHLDYLAAQGYVQPDWEHFDLEPLQGVEGLRAIRAKLTEDLPKKMPRKTV